MICLESGCMPPMTRSSLPISATDKPVEYGASSARTPSSLPWTTLNKGWKMLRSRSEWTHLPVCEPAAGLLLPWSPSSSRLGSLPCLLSLGPWSQTPSLCSDTQTAGFCPVSKGLIVPTPMPPLFTTRSSLFESGKHSTLNIHKPEYKAMRSMPQNSYQNKVLLLYSHPIFVCLYSYLYMHIEILYLEFYFLPLQLSFYF